MGADKAPRRGADLRTIAATLVGGLPAQFWLLWAGILINRIGGFVMPLIALDLARPGLCPEQVGDTISPYGPWNLAGRPDAGVCADPAASSGSGRSGPGFGSVGD